MLNSRRALTDLLRVVSVWLGRGERAEVGDMEVSEGGEVGKNPCSAGRTEGRGEHCAMRVGSGGWLRRLPETGPLGSPRQEQAGWGLLGMGSLALLSDSSQANSLP